MPETQSDHGFLRRLDLEGRFGPTFRWEAYGLEVTADKKGVMVQGFSDHLAQVEDLRNVLLLAAGVSAHLGIGTPPEAIIFQR